MIPNLGRALVLLALLFATVGSVTGLFAALKKSREAWVWTRNSALGFAASIIAANLLMVFALVTHDFSVAYVAEVGSRSTPLYFTIVSLWASLNGSILFWGGVLGLYVGGLVLSMGDRHREYMPWTLHVLLGISIFFTALVAGVANPFEPVYPVPADGPGPNPLLQNHWLMAVHPPALYLGYVGMSVPFAMICAGLLAGRMEEGWLAPLRRWMLVPWAFLTLGIVLGGWWSYAVLGWGGAWAWDPVENASFHPWLTGTAFLHSIMVLQRRGLLRDWTLVLGMATFLLTLVGTFMTRSGVFNSVHSFTQSDIGPVFLGFIAVVLGYSVLLLAARSHTLDDASSTSQQRLGALSSGGRQRILSRETAILVQNALFTVFTFVVLLGTLYPLLAEALQDRRISVGEPYFDRWALPLGLGIVFMMGVGPALPWGRIASREIGRRLGLPVITGVLASVVALATGITKPFTLLSLFLCGYALHANLAEFVHPVLQRMRARQESVLVAAGRVWGRARRRFGGHVAHFGVILAVFALAVSKGYRVEQDFSLATGESGVFAGEFEVRFDGARLVRQDHRDSHVAAFTMLRDGREIAQFEPRLNYYPRQREPIFTPAVHSTPRGDYYFSLVEIPVDGQSVVVRVIDQPAMMWLWLSAPFMLLGTGISLWPERRRTARSASVEIAEPGAAK